MGHEVSVWCDLLRISNFHFRIFHLKFIRHDGQACRQVGLVPVMCDLVLLFGISGFSASDSFSSAIGIYDNFL